MTKAKQTVAKGIRVLSVPPVMVTALLLFLSIWKPYFFRTWREIFICILLLGIVPALAYPLQKNSAPLEERRTGRTAEAGISV